MKYLDMELVGKNNGEFYFIDRDLDDQYNGVPPRNDAARLGFMKKYRLKPTRDSSWPRWCALLPTEIKKKIKIKEGYKTYNPYRLADKRLNTLHDHDELFRGEQGFVYTSQPYDVSLDAFLGLSEAMGILGLYVTISIKDAWYIPGATPLIVISQYELNP